MLMLWCFAAEACRPERMMVAVTTDLRRVPIPADADGSQEGLSAVMAEYKLAEHEKHRAWKILACGSVAGTLSGLMGTLAGQPGPPLILMFALLKVPKVLQECSVSSVVHCVCCSVQCGCATHTQFFCVTMCDKHYVLWVLSHLSYAVGFYPIHPM